MVTALGDWAWTPLPGTTHVKFSVTKSAASAAF